MYEIDENMKTLKNRQHILKKLLRNALFREV